jgi:ATP-dependent Clp protease adaptor protein ClpS
MQTTPAPQIEILKTTETQNAEEPLYRVLIHNDDITPMDFVVTMLKTIFFLSTSDALIVMFRAHTTGLALVQVLPLSEAKARIGKAHFAAGLEGFPLRFSLEPAD